MLQAIRDKAQGWIAWVIVILITIPFALWGIQEYLGVGGEKTVATVEGQEITQRQLDLRTREYRDNLRATLGNNYREDMFDDALLKQQIRERMIEEMLLLETADAWNLRAGDEQVHALIRSIPAFLKDGRFDSDTYSAALRARGMTSSGFQSSVRQDIVMRQLQQGIRDSAFVTDAALADSVRLQHQRRDVSYVRIPARQLRANLAVDDGEVQAWFDANRDAYVVPERVKLGYILLDAGRLVGQVDVSEDDVRDHFEQNRDLFVLAEQRQMRHILVKADAGDADSEAAAKAKAGDLLQQLRGGADFAELARTNSDDPGSAASGGDLGWVDRGMMVGPFEEAGFALEKGVVSEPVKTDFGYHLIEVTAIRGGSDVTYDEVRDSVEAAYRKKAAGQLFYDSVERLATTTYEDPNSLEGAAEALGLKVEETDWINRGSLPALPLASGKVATAAFSEDVLNQRHNSEVIELGETSAAVIRVVEHQAQRNKALDEVKEAVTQDALAAKAVEAAANKGKDALAKLRTGELDLAGLSDAEGWPVEKMGYIKRDQRNLPTEVSVAAFALAPPLADSIAYDGVVSAEGDYFLVAVNAMEYADVASREESENTGARQQYAAQLAKSDFLGMVDGLRARAEVELQNIDVDSAQ